MGDRLERTLRTSEALTEQRVRHIEAVASTMNPERRAELLAEAERLGQQQRELWAGQAQRQRPALDANQRVRVNCELHCGATTLGSMAINGLCDGAGCPYEHKPIIALVACSASKQDHGMAAEHLYSSTWFRLARTFARKNADRWFILSAKHGLVAPHHWLAPYNEELHGRRSKREEWAGDVADLVQDWTDSRPEDTTIILLGGIKYRSPLADFLRQRGYTVETPLEGMGIGKQQQYLKQHSQQAGS